MRFYIANIHGEMYDTYMLSFAIIEVGYSIVV
jgi:hypothetical protein